MPSSDLKIKVGVDSKGVKSGVKEAKTSIKGLGRTIQTALGFSASRVFSSMAAFLKQTISSAFVIAARFEMINVQFEALIGNTAKAKKLMGELREFSVKTPFTPEDVFKAGKILLTQFPAKEVTGEIRTLGEVAAVTGKDLNELAMIYAKVAERGKVNARILNQFGNAGIPLSRFLAKVKNVGVGDIRGLSEQGKLSFDDMRDALRLLAAEFGGLERASGTVHGRFSTLVGVAKEFMATIGEAMKGQTLDAINNIITQFGKLAGLAPEVSKAINGLAFSFDTTRAIMAETAAAMEVVLGFQAKLVNSNIDPFGGPMVAQLRELKAIREAKLKNFARTGSFSMPFGSPDKTGSGDFSSPVGRGLSSSIAEGMKAAMTDSNAQLGLFGSGRANMADVQTLQLDELKTTNALLSEIEQRGRPQNSSLDAVINRAMKTMREGAGR